MKLRLLGILGLALLLSSWGNETNDFNKDSEIINGITIGDILKMKEDYLNTLKVSKQVTKKDVEKVNVIVLVLRSILNVFAPLL